MVSKPMKKLLLFSVVAFISKWGLSQDIEKKLTLSDSLSLAFAKLDSLKKATTPAKPQNTLTISAELRTRTEFRRGYRVLPLGDTLPSFFTIHRTRINLDYKSKKLDLYASLQESRTWGAIDPRNPTVPVSFFEAYAEPHFSEKFSIRVGRQRIFYDNQRLFAENDWRNPANAHDAIRLIYNNKVNLTTEFAGAFNQSAENNYTANYKPVGFVNYKTLVIHYLNYKINKNFTLLTLNAMDGFQSSNPNDYKTTYIRFTNGGKIEYNSYNWTALVMAYYQYGKDSTGKKLSAYFLNPEVKYTNKALTVRLGMELMSGQDATRPTTKNNSFVPLYGVAHRFNGNLDFFTTFPTDLNNAGLINPYLFFWYQKNKIYLRIENHLFYSQNNFVKNGFPIKKYLGFENDWRLNYKVFPSFEIETGFCWAAVTESMVIIKKSGDANKIPYWSYVSLKFTPTIGKFTF